MYPPQQPQRPTFTPNPYPPRQQPPMPPQGWPQQPPAGNWNGYGYQPQHQPVQQQPRPRRKRRVFLWIFLAIQVLFILWIVVGLATTHTGATAAQLAQQCGGNNWFPLFKSHTDCVTHYGGALNDAGNAGKAIGAGIIVAFWFVVDVILGIGYGIYRLATR